VRSTHEQRVAWTDRVIGYMLGISVARGEDGRAPKDQR